MLKCKKIVTSLIVLSTIGTLLAGCAKEKVVEQTNNTTETTQQTALTLPIVKEPLTLTYWVPFNASMAAVMKNLEEALPYQEAEKRTGIKIKFIHPPIGQDKENFNLMLASNDLPDLIQRDWLAYPGGPEKAIEDGVIIKLNDLIDKNAINYKNFITNQKQVEKMVKTDSGTHYVIPGVITEAAPGAGYTEPAKRAVFIETWAGPTVRKDWLDELGLKLPTTMDEWYTMLKAFKDKKGATAPLTFQKLADLNTTKAFAGAYKVSFGFYPEGGKVLYGPLEPGYKEFVATFQKWYKEGLIDPDFASNDQKTMDAKITGGKSGAWLGAHGNYIGRMLSLMSAKEPKFDPTPVAYPTVKAGEKPKYGHKDLSYRPSQSVAITKANKHPVETIKYLDYPYSKEGDLLFNWGVEGVTYKMVNGQPTLTETITKNPENKPVNQIMLKYMVWNGPISMDYRTRRESWVVWNTPKIEEASKVWGTAESDGKMPPVTLLAEESETYANVMNEINAYVDEMFLKFVIGGESMNNWDAFVEKVKKMGIDKALKTQQAALDRYNKR